jgi:hypothetical protein
VGGVIGVRMLSGVGGPQAAHAATDTEAEFSDEAVDEATTDAASIDRAWVVAARESTTLGTAAAEHLRAWNSPLFPVVEGTQGPTEAEETSGAPMMAPTPPSAAGFADMFRVTSLMTTRDGPVAVIDRKLRRLGDDLGEGVTVDAIDLARRVVTLRAPDGAVFERRANR